MLYESGSSNNLTLKENSVAVNIWLPDPEKDRPVGHVSLDIGCQYISFFPKNSQKEGVRDYISGSGYISGKPGAFSNDVEEDYKKENGTPTYQFIINDLNPKEMLEKFKKIKEDVENGKILWSLSSSPCTPSSNCSKLTMQLLLAGGIQSRLPSDAQFGTLSHLTLLCSSRVYITISFLACGLYPILDDMATDNSHAISIIATLLMTLLSNSMIFILEKKFRDTSLKELNKDDYIVGVGSSLGFGSVALLNKWLERTKITNVILQYFNSDNFLNKAIFDAIFLLPGTLVGLYVGGYISSLLITSCDCSFHCRGRACTVSSCSCCHRGITYTVSPTNMYEWLSYIDKTKHIPKEVLNFVNKTNYVSLSILYTGWIACFFARKGFFITDSKDFFRTGLNLESGIPALYIGLPTGIILGYALTKSYMKKYIQKIKNLESKSHEIGAEYQLIISNSWNIEQYQYLEKYSFTTTTTLLGLMMIISIFDCFSFNGYVLEKGILSPFGAVGGFLFGSAFFENYLSERTHFIEPESEPLLSDKNTRILTSYNLKHGSKINGNVQQEKTKPSQKKCPCAIL